MNKNKEKPQKKTPHEKVFVISKKIGLPVHLGDIYFHDGDTIKEDVGKGSKRFLTTDKDDKPIRTGSENQIINEDKNTRNVVTQYIENLEGLDHEELTHYLKEGNKIVLYSNGAIINGDKFFLKGRTLLIFKLLCENIINKNDPYTRVSEIWDLQSKLFYNDDEDSIIGDVNFRVAQQIRRLRTKLFNVSQKILYPSFEERKSVKFKEKEDKKKMKEIEDKEKRNKMRKYRKSKIKDDKPYTIIIGEPKKGYSIDVLPENIEIIDDKLF